MNNITDDNRIQGVDINPDNEKESLGLANFFLEQMMPKAQPDASQTPETAPEQGEDLDLEEEPREQEPEKEDTETRIAKMETMMAEMKGMMEKMMETKHGETEKYQK